ncbi:MAG: hypothetical protein LUO89_11235 [Methanothrix sp.]|nr:hypothetical protein [Methanothrix sp.]
MTNQAEGYGSMSAPSRPAQVPTRIERVKHAVAGHIELLKKLEGRLTVALRPPGGFTSVQQTVKQEEELVGIAKDLEDILQLVSEADNVANSILQRLEL